MLDTQNSRCLYLFFKALASFCVCSILSRKDKFEDRVGKSKSIKVKSEMEINARKHPTKREKREETHKHKRREERSRKRSRFHSPDRVLALSENVEDCEEKVTLEIWEEKSSFILRFLVECRLIRGCEETEFDGEKKKKKIFI